MTGQLNWRTPMIGPVSLSSGSLYYGMTASAITGCRENRVPNRLSHPLLLWTQPVFLNLPITSFNLNPSQFNLNLAPFSLNLSHIYPN